MHHHCKTITALAMFFLCTIASAQQQTTDSIPIDTIPKHNPKRAALMSAMVPGLGQAYNRKYWKLPIIYSGIGAGVYFISSNSKLMADMKTELDLNKGNANFNITPLQQDYLYYKRNRELNIIMMGLLYFINIVDAAVDAHLYDFDISKDLSFQLSPTLLPSNNMGLMCTIRF